MYLILLIGLHNLADTFQPGWLINDKKKYVFAHYTHAVCWAFIMYVGLICLGIDEPWKFFFLAVIHFFIDYTFYILLPKWYNKTYNWVWFDQALHYLQILIVWMF